MLWVIIALLVVIVVLLGGGGILIALLTLASLVIVVPLLVWGVTNYPWIIGVSVVIVAGIVLLFYASEGKQRSDRSGTELHRLLEQAGPIEPQISRHPNGTFILVNKDGALSAFRSLERARLHRDHPPSLKPKTEADA